MICFKKQETGLGKTEMPQPAARFVVRRRGQSRWRPKNGIKSSLGPTLLRKREFLNKRQCKPDQLTDIQALSANISSKMVSTGRVFRMAMCVREVGG